ncbi:putative 1,3-beta-D-glucan synthase SCDLUD_004419 [Saccharomycodes ludwigii]|uniref:putative 1,3-beta-D-glucan synthase n=1 Tax=Saccharomycodes ludwigii TaxID=36035 RepID=UPI001E86F3A4|nr:hypothetical protein SCDLUD_004419 [Saccharomycodes ludwigii]KAH3898998.1 hypothetical protein SCDLUD_004419 [Saccharomycodes ludwigii]
MDVQYKPKLLISQVWNAVVISMYREHLLSIDHVRRLLYQQVDSVMPGKKTLKSPTFFVAEDDSTFKSTEYFQENSEAQRRVSFFAQSLSTPITEPIPVECMPSFTVLIPHYSEKIVLSLREIIKEENANTKITLLEYLKQLYPHEWECFVRDTKLLAFESGYISSDKAKRGNLDQEEKEDDSHANNSPNLTNNDNDYDFIQNRINDLPFYSVGFNSSNAEFTLRTRIWASLRTQTLYRTISGFMNYAKAIKLLYRIENPSMVQVYGEDQEGLDLELEGMANRKFKMVVSMQRLEKFTPNELEATNFLLRAYPHLRIAYLEENKQDSHIYSCLIDGFCDIDAETGKRIPMYRVRLSGNPILGDGKSDNQNHAIIFYRGEYIQVIDANQDNYLEECLKIRSVLSEFEELEMDNTLPYIPGVEYHYDKAPVAIVGAREYIFSENIGVLGDIAAGKEQTFGTLFARTLAEIGAKLHYGHPDFINAIFMTTRGGLSKSQKGLHLNEDIYAGMTAICRGGRIKHSDYYQCGKGRDLGFCQILNFTTKIGAGMGEQLLSREYYYIGTQMPIDRFLSFFYAHPGFHLNNLFITMSVQLFFLLLLNIGSMNHELIKCVYNKDIPITDVEKPIGCYNLEPVLHWVTIFVLSIFIVFFISFAPLLIQELLERGIWKSISRFFHHILSMAPFFEVFVCQIYSNSLMSDVTFGGARYISTGRGFAVTRIEFYQLYTRFSTTSIYSGCKLFLMLLFSMVSMWQPALLWFCITLISMCLAPFIFNPHQFSFVDFFVDYRELLRWFSHGYGAYSPNSWTSYTKVSRARYTGFKKKMISDESEKNLPDIKKPYFKNLFVAEFLKPVFTFIFSFTAYTFINAQTGVRMVQPTNSVLRLVIVGLMPILVNQIVLAFLFAVALFTGPTTSCFCNKTGDLMAGISHTVSVFIYLLDFQVIWFLEGWDFTRTLLLLIVIINLHDVIFKFITIFMLTREFKNNKSSIAWWSGNWYRTGMGWATITQPMREYTIQIMESSYFTADFLCSHLLLSLQVPFVFIPFFDRCHSMILFWLKPNILNTQKFIYTKKQLIRRKKIVRRYIFIYFVILTSLLTFLVLPIFTAKYIPDISGTLSKTTFEGLIQPKMQHNNDTGENAPKTFLLKAPEPGPIIKTVR